MNKTINKKVAVLAVVIVAVAIAMSFSATGAKAKKEKWGNQYTRANSLFKGFEDAVSIDGTVYYSAKKKKTSNSEVIKLDGRTSVYSRATGGASLVIYEVNHKPLYYSEDATGGFYYDGTAYTGSRPGEVGNTLVYTQGDSSTDYDLYIGTSKISNLSSYCNDDDLGRIEAHPSEAMIKYNGNFYLNCENSQKTVIFSSSGAKIGEQSGGDMLYANAVCNGDEVVAQSAPVRTINTEGTGGTYMKYGGAYITDRSDVCSGGNIYYALMENGGEAYNLYKNGTVIATDKSPIDFVIVGGKAYWMKDRDKHIYSEAGAVFAKPKGGWGVWQMLDVHGKLGLLMWNRAPKTKNMQWTILVKK